ncbi:MAG: peptidylprolyl isomerase [Alphaproteobacteria bacterium]
MSFLFAGTTRLGACALWAAVVVLMVPAASSSLAQEPKVLATVDGAPITDADLALAQDILGPRLARVPEAMRPRILLDLLIDRKLFAKVARAAKVPDLASYKAQVAYFAEDALRDIYVSKIIGKSISPEAVRARYDAEVAKQAAPEEMRARHILVKTEVEAKDLIKQLEGGADFAELAKTKSTGPSGAKGGDLGFFTAKEMVPAFSAAAQALEPGKISAPVKTQFGWHVIKLEEKRLRQPPSFEQVGKSLREVLLSEKVRETAKNLRDAAVVDYLDPALKPPAQ